MGWFTSRKSKKIEAEKLALINYIANIILLYKNDKNLTWFDIHRNLNMILSTVGLILADENPQYHSDYSNIARKAATEGMDSVLMFILCSVTIEFGEGAYEDFVKLSATIDSILLDKGFPDFIINY
ncbi:hypothetical protein [Psychrobacter sp. FDAARGOS_221]|uniref:hypothetical protein n=1 Tax=Psychrobacter sp. FDAARGOS_221 TaxID=1975705 RepID=UPI000BB53F4A|nr:hypothetical protein [Psychrobacter sp. FDAARGOS_221]PNK59896.1 hypothetical protein A6J60_002725 [Psychrobacter sp. FDAARGOS_221]